MICCHTTLPSALRAQPSDQCGTATTHLGNTQALTKVRWSCPAPPGAKSGRGSLPRSLPRTSLSSVSIEVLPPEPSPACPSVLMSPHSHSPRMCHTAGCCRCRPCRRGRVRHGGDERNAARVSEGRCNRKWWLCITPWIPCRGDFARWPCTKAVEGQGKAVKGQGKAVKGSGRPRKCQ